MGIAFGRVEKQIDDAGSGDVSPLGRDVGEDNAGGDGGGGPCAREGKEVLFAEIRKAEEPENGVGEGGEDAQVEAEC